MSREDKPLRSFLQFSILSEPLFSQSANGQGVPQLPIVP